MWEREKGASGQGAGYSTAVPPPPHAPRPSYFPTDSWPSLTVCLLCLLTAMSREIIDFRAEIERREEELRECCLLQGLDCPPGSLLTATEAWKDFSDVVDERIDAIMQQVKSTIIPVSASTSDDNICLMNDASHP